MHRHGFRRVQGSSVNEATRRAHAARHRVVAPKRPTRTVPQFDTNPLPKAKAEDKTTVAFNDMDFATQCAFIPAHVDPKQTDQNTKMYCGAKRFPGMAWCEAHCLRCYQPIYLQSKGIKISVPKKAHELA